MRSKTFYLLLLVILTGCVGYNFPPNIFAGKPYTLLRGSEQIGRDQLTNRLLIGKNAFSIRGKLSNDVLSLLGQPQEIHVVQTGVSEDWLYIYLKGISKRASGEKAAFLVRFYQDKVIDVVHDYPDF